MAVVAPRPLPTAGQCAWYAGEPGTPIAMCCREGNFFPLEAAVQRSIILFVFDVAVLAGFGVYLTLTIGGMSDDIRMRLLGGAARFGVTMLQLVWRMLS